MTEYGLVGHPLNHSFSKPIHKELFGYNYELFDLGEQKFAFFMKRRAFKGINVTIPYKVKVIKYLDYLDKSAKITGCVNTVVNDNGKLCGYNTDFNGLENMLRVNGIELGGKRVIILGSGGTSLTALAVAKSHGAKEIVRVSRKNKDDCITYKKALYECVDFEVMINTTPMGMYPNIGNSAISLDNFKNLEAVVDVVYNPLRSQLVLDAKKRGITAVGGLYMLISQAAVSGQYFTGKKISERRINELYKKLLNEKQNIVLTGMAGCGKSTLGLRLAKSLNRDFYDTDDIIRKETGLSAKEIIEKYGEKHFRDAESKAIKGISGVTGAVIATGGGAILKGENVDYLKANGHVFFLKRPAFMLPRDKRRPLASDIDAVEKLYNKRYETYVSTADTVIDASGTKAQNERKVYGEFFK